MLGTLLLFASLSILAVTQAFPHGLTPHQIGEAKKRCQLNCAHVSAAGRGVVLHNRCVQTCWNEFFQSMIDHKPPTTAVHPVSLFKPAPHRNSHPKPPSKAVMHNVMHSTRGILDSGHNRMVHSNARGAPSAGAQLTRLGTVALGVLLLVGVGLLL